jgi:hypothetical protein
MLAFLQAYSPPAFHASACAPRVLRVNIRLMKSDGAILITYLQLNCCCSPEKEGNSKVPYKFARKGSNFGIHLWPRVTLVTLLKYGNGVISIGDFNSGVKKYFF